MTLLRLSLPSSRIRGVGLVLGHFQVLTGYSEVMTSPSPIPPTHNLGPLGVC